MMNQGGLSQQYYAHLLEQKKAAAQQTQQMAPFAMIQQLMSLLGDDPRSMQMLQGLLRKTQGQALDKLITPADQQAYAGDLKSNKNTLPFLQDQQNTYQQNLAKANTDYDATQKGYMGPMRDRPAYLSGKSTMPTYMNELELQWQKSHRNAKGELDPTTYEDAVPKFPNRMDQLNDVGRWA